MSTNTAELQRIKGEAQDWIIELSSGDTTQQERESFEQWLNADSRHAEAYWQSRKVWAALGEVGESFNVQRSTFNVDQEQITSLFEKEGPGEIQIPLNPPLPKGEVLKAKTRYYAPLALAASLLLAAGLLFLVNPFGGDPSPAGVVATQTAQIRDLVLADDSRVTLGAKSIINIQFDGNTRRVVLEGGEAFFTVAKDPQRPFIVAVDGMEVSVVGTQFDVHRGVEQVRVAVLDGAVQVATANQQKELLTAGRQLVAGLQTAPVISNIQGDKPGAWREGRLSYQGAPLVEVIADANRYYTRRITLASADLNNLRVTASFRTDRIDQMLDTLVMALPVTLEETGFGLMLKPKG